MSSRQRVNELVRRLTPGPVYRVALSLAHPANSGRRLRTASRALRFEFLARPRGRPMVVPLGSHSRVIAHPQETNSPNAVYTNPPNWREMRLWQQLLHPGDLFVDVGGNVGIYTIMAQDLGAQTITFEPDRRNYERIREHLELNGYRGEVHAKAVADAAGMRRFTEGLDSYNHLLDGGQDGIEVETVTLDEVIGDREVAGLKIDVEGAERLVLEGARRALQDGRIRVIQLEWSSREVERTLHETRAPIEVLLRGYGYLLYRPDDGGRIGRLDGPVPPGRDVFASPHPLEWGS